MNDFNPIAKDYERIHNAHLPHVVKSEEFLIQKVEFVKVLLARNFPNQENIGILDFGCGNGRTAELLLAVPQIANYCGIDESWESLKEAHIRTRLTQKAVRFIADPRQIDDDEKFDLVLCFNVFHHVEPTQRAEKIRQLKSVMKKEGVLLVWEHNPLSPLARILVSACPFDKGVKLIGPQKLQNLFNAEGFENEDFQYLNLTPPKWHRFKVFKKCEDLFKKIPMGAQYWSLFRP